MFHSLKPHNSPKKQVILSYSFYKLGHVEVKYGPWLNLAHGKADSKDETTLEPGDCGTLDFGRKAHTFSPRCYKTPHQSATDET